MLLPPEMELVGWSPVPSAGLSIKFACLNHNWLEGFPHQLGSGLTYHHYPFQARAEHTNLRN